MECKAVNKWIDKKRERDIESFPIIRGCCKCERSEKLKERYNSVATVLFKSIKYLIYLTLITQQRKKTKRWNETKRASSYFLKIILEPLSNLLILSHKTKYLCYNFYKINLSEFTFKLLLLVLVGAYLSFLIPRILSAFETPAGSSARVLNKHIITWNQEALSFALFSSFTRCPANSTISPGLTI